MNEEAKNYQLGDVVDYTPTAARAAGQVVQVAGMAGFCATAIAANVKGAAQVGNVGKFRAAAVTGIAGQRIGWDEDGDPYGGTAGTGAATTNLVDADFLLGTLLIALTATAGKAIVLLNKLTDSYAVESARSRAVTALLTEAIWRNFNLLGMRNNPFAGSLLDTDFTHGEGEPAAQFADTSAVIDIRPGTAGEGTLILFSTADNEAAEVQWPSCPILSSGGQPWAFEARIKTSLIDDTKGGGFIGLMAGDTALAGDLIADGGTLADVGAIGFQWKEGDGDILDVVYDKNAQTQNEHSADWHTLVADTYVTVAMYYDGTTIAMYKNGAASGTAISAVDMRRRTSRQPISSCRHSR